MPNILFIHENFPAQFGGLAGYLASRGWTVVFATAAPHLPEDHATRTLIPGVRVVHYESKRQLPRKTPGMARTTLQAMYNGRAFARIGAALARKGFDPDVIVAHSGWGSGSFARTIWPRARYVQYLEWWYNSAHLAGQSRLGPHQGRKVASHTLCRNLPFLMDAQVADAILVPTQFQANQVPALLKPLLHVLHDGVDDTRFRPARPDEPRFKWDGLPDTSRIVTYATRGMEPMRGFPAFMEAWATLQHELPDVHCVIAGTDRVCYGDQLPEGQSFKQRALAQFDFDASRLHFTGALPKPSYCALLQRSSAHVYLTKPFVLSWSLIETMMTGTPLVTSRTPPVQEAVPAGTATYVDMEKPADIARAVAQLLNAPELARKQADAARAHARETYAARLLWPQHEAFLRDLIGAQQVRQSA